MPYGVVLTTESSLPTAVKTAFAAFLEKVEPRLRAALVAHLGGQRGREATVDALAYAWEHWHRLEPMDNPAGYLYRMATRAATRSRVSSPTPLANADQHADTAPAVEYEPRLPEALAALSAKQRTAVLLVHGWHYSLAEAAATLGMSVSTLRTHLDRGPARLRSSLEVSDDIRD